MPGSRASGGRLLESEVRERCGIGLVDIGEPLESGSLQQLVLRCDDNRDWSVQAGVR